MSSIIIRLVCGLLFSAMVLGAVLCYPFAKVLWLGVDVSLRPVEHEEPPGVVAPPLDPNSPAYRRAR